jgi:hypothetical protein
MKGVKVAKLVGNLTVPQVEKSYYRYYRGKLEQNVHE